MVKIENYSFFFFFENPALSFTEFTLQKRFSLYSATELWKKGCSPFCLILIISHFFLLYYHFLLDVENYKIW